MPTISVIVPVYNTEKYLSRCLDSILGQTFTDFELLLVDDGSTDASGSICDGYAEKDPRVRVFHQENQGQAAARNHALDWIFANSDSEYISFIDSDDWVHSQYLELLYEGIKRYNVNICQCGLFYTDGTRQLPSAEVDIIEITPEEQYIHWYCASACSKLYRIQVFQQTRFPEGKIYEDVAISYRILFAEQNLALVTSPQYYYFTRPESTTHIDWTEAHYSRIEIWEEQRQFFKANGSRALLSAVIGKYFIVLRQQVEQVSKSQAISTETRKKYLSRLRRRARFLFVVHFSLIPRPKTPCFAVAFPHIYSIGVKVRIRNRLRHLFPAHRSK